MCGGQASLFNTEKEIRKYFVQWGWNALTLPCKIVILLVIFITDHIIEIEFALYLLCY